MTKDKKKSQDGPLTGRYKREFVEFYCPICQVSKIVCIPEENTPHCEYCKKEMVMREILTEGKY